MSLGPEARRLLASTKHVDDPSLADQARMRARLDASWAPGASPRGPSPTKPIPRALFSNAKFVVGAVSVLTLVSWGAWRATRAPVEVARPGPQSAPISALQALPPSAAGPEPPPEAAPEPRPQHDTATPRMRTRAPRVESTSAPQAPPPSAARAAARPRPAPEPAPAPAPAAQALPSFDPVPSPTPSPSVLPAPRLVTIAQAPADAPAQQPKRAELQPIDAELTLLGAAQDALQAGKPSAALKLSQEHAFRFPQGALARERLTVHTLALCALQRKATARQVFDELARRAQDSPLLARIRNDCGF